MASILNVDQINNAAGTSGIALDASTGKPSFPNGAVLPAGSVIQVVNTTWGSSNQTINGTTFTEITNLTTSITPFFTGSKILVQSNIDFGNAFNGAIWYEWKLYRDTTSNLVASAATYFSGVYGNPIGPHTLFNTIDSNTTTAGVSRSYKVYGRADGNSSGSLSINWSTSQGSTSSMTLMEIAQ